jgi:hypothetical protein
MVQFLVTAVVLFGVCSIACFSRPVVFRLVPNGRRHSLNWLLVNPQRPLPQSGQKLTTRHPFESEQTSHSCVATGFNLILCGATTFAHCDEQTSRVEQTSRQPHRSLAPFTPVTTGSPILNHPERRIVARPWRPCLHASPPHERTVTLGEPFLNHTGYSGSRRTLILCNSSLRTCTIQKFVPYCALDDPPPDIRPTPST